MDYGHRESDRRLRELEKQIDSKYRLAFRDVKKKTEEYLSHFSKQNEEMQDRLEDGEITEDEYFEWREKTMLHGERYQKYINDVSEHMVNIDVETVALIAGAMLGIYIVNANYGYFEVCKGTGYNLPFVRKNTKNTPKKRIRVPSVDVAKDKKWMKNKINASIYNSMKQGKSIPNIADDLQQVVNMDRASAIRTARTTVTRIENSARVDSYREAEDMGIRLKQKWVAVLDMRTRSSHRHLDGEIAEIGKPFSNDLRYPGDDSTGHPEEYYNCRCTLEAEIEGIEYKDERWSRLPEGMSYEEWERGGR